MAPKDQLAGNIAPPSEIRTFSDETARLPTVGIDSDRLPPIGRFTLFRLRASRFYDLSLRAEPREKFRVRAQAWFYGDLIVAAAETFCGMSFNRTRKHIEKSGSDQCTVILLHSGGMSGEFDGAAVAASEGDVLIIDRTRPVSMAITRLRITVLVIRRDRIAPFLPNGAPPHGHVVPGAAGALLADFVRSLERQSPAVTLQEARHVERGACEMVVACIAPSQERLSQATAQLEQSWRIEAKRFIDAELENADLGPDDVARRLGLSRSKLYRLFEAEEGGVAALIRRRRLRAACRLLMNPNERRRISDIAYACGFKSETYFSRAFRETFDLSPSAYRETRGATAAPNPEGAEAIEHVMQDWLARMD